MRGERERTCCENDVSLLRSSGMRVRPRACAFANIFSPRFPENRPVNRLLSGLLSRLLPAFNEESAIEPSSTLE